MTEKTEITSGYGFGQTEEGSKYVAKIDGNTEWALFTTKMAPMAQRMQKQIQDELNIPCVLGEPYDWRKSLQNDTLIYVDRHQLCRGVYIDPKQFDSLILKLRGN